MFWCGCGFTSCVMVCCCCCCCCCCGGESLCRCFFLIRWSWISKKSTNKSRKILAVWAPQWETAEIRLMEEILHHLGWLKPYKQWDNHHPWWLAGFCPSTVSPSKCGDHFKRQRIKDFTHRTPWKMGPRTFQETVYEGSLGYLSQGPCGQNHWKDHFPTITRRWFQIFFIFTPKIGEDSHFDEHVIFFKGVGSTTNQIIFWGESCLGFSLFSSNLS